MNTNTAKTTSVPTFATTPENHLANPKTLKPKRFGNRLQATTAAVKLGLVPDQYEVVSDNDRFLVLIVNSPRSNLKTCLMQPRKRPFAVLVDHTSHYITPRNRHNQHLVDQSPRSGKKRFRKSLV